MYIYIDICIDVAQPDPPLAYRKGNPIILKSQYKEEEEEKHLKYKTLNATKERIMFECVMLGW